MHFRDTQQLAGACSALLRPIGLSHLWGPAGPSDDAIAARTKPPADAQHRLLFSIAHTLWTSSGSLTVAELLDLDPPFLRLVAQLLTAAASGEEHVDRWISQTLTKRLS